MKNLTFVSGYWLPPHPADWWQLKNSHHNFMDGLDKLFCSLDHIDKDIPFVFLYNKYSAPILNLKKYPRVIPLDITDYYDWDRPQNFWVKFAMTNVIWEKFGSYFWFDADSEFNQTVSRAELEWIDDLKNGVAFHAVCPWVTTTYEEFGLRLDLTHETERGRLDELYGTPPTQALVTSAIHLMANENYAKKCGQVDRDTIKSGITPYNDEWGHISVLKQLGIELENNESLSLRKVWPKCITFHHNVARFYGKNYF